jgi:hypothetical protein
LRYHVKTYFDFRNISYKQKTSIFLFKKGVNKKKEGLTPHLTPNSASKTTFAILHFLSNWLFSLKALNNPEPIFPYL